MIASWGALALAAVLVAVGWPLARGGGGGGWRSERLLLAGTAGLLVLAGGMMLAELAGVPWNRATLLGLALAGGAALRLAPSPGPASSSGSQSFGWGDAVASIAVGVFAWIAVQGWAVHPDFVYHWGLKGAKFHLHRGIDWELLALPWEGRIHPGYPNLLPVLFAATATVGGAFEMAAMMLWSPLLLGGVVIAGRHALSVAGVQRGLGQAAVACLALSGAMFAVGYRTAGGADDLLALAALLPAAALLSPRSPGSALTIGLAAALAVGSKVEGAPLAAALVALYLWRRGGVSKPVALLATVPAGLFLLLWRLPLWWHSLELSPMTALPAPGRAGAVLAEMGAALETPAWHGAGYLLWVAPLLILVPASRPLAVVATAQLGSFFYAYLAAPFTAQDEVSYWVASSLPRLASQVVPLLIVALAIALDQWVRGRDALALESSHSPD